MKETMKLKKQAIKIKEQKGITLIALIVTIIILLILAGVTINKALGKNGLISKTEEAVEKHKEEAAMEKVSMTFAECMLIEKAGLTEEEKNKQIIKALEEIGDVTDNGDHYTVIVDGYIFDVDKESYEISSQGADKQVEITKISVDNKNVEMYKGETAQISLNITPSEGRARHVNFKSNNESIAEVDANGKITGKSEGETTITITAKNDEKISETINVKIKEIPVQVESIILNPITLELKVGDTSAAINVTYNPSNATVSEVTWSTSDRTKATVDEEGKVTGISAGTVRITATTANGKTATCSVTVNVKLPDVGATVPTGGWSIEVAKGLVKRDGLRAHIGETVSFSPKAGGTWRIFYYNTEAEWGDPKGTLYLKRDYDSGLYTALALQGSPNEATVQKMKDMNPMWDKNGNSSTIDLANEQGVVNLYDQSQWEDYYRTLKGTALASYAIGSPSVEMYMKSYNIWIAGTTNISSSTQAAKTLMCKVDNDDGYKVGVFGSYTYDSSAQYYTGKNTIEEGPGGIFMTKGSSCWWLASPSFGQHYYVCSVSGDSAAVVGSSTYASGKGYTVEKGVCPVVSIQP